MEINNNSSFVIKFLYEDALLIGTKIFRHDTLICKSSYVYESDRIINVRTAYFYQDSWNTKPLYWQYLYNDGAISSIIYDTTSKAAYGYDDEFYHYKYNDEDSIIKYMKWDNMPFIEKLKTEDPFYWERSGFSISQRCSSVMLVWDNDNVICRQEFYRKYYYHRDECKLTKFYYEDDNHYSYTSNKNPFKLPQGVGHEFQFVLQGPFYNIATLWSSSFPSNNFYKYDFQNGYPTKGKYQNSSIHYSYIK